MGETPPMDEEKPKIRWKTYAVSPFWAALLILPAWVVPPFRQMFEEMGKGTVLPLPTRAILAIPWVAWIVLCILVPGTLIWKANVLSRKAAHRVDLAAAGLCFIAGGFVVVALFLPLIQLQ